MGHTLTVYDAVNQAVLSLIPPTANRILDIGCGTGTMGECLRRMRERYVVGITYSRQEADLASKRISKVECGDLNGFDFSTLGVFDCVIMSHILEHLYSPDDLLEKLKCALASESVIIVALPNILHWKQRKEFLAGRWRYQDGGIMDRTHFRFFDRNSSKELLERTGYEILATTNDGVFPLTGPVRRSIGQAATKVDQVMCGLAPGLFAVQFVYLAKLRK